jgi:hypothetical protein
VVGSGAASPRRIRARIEFIGRTMKKYTAAAIRMNETSALINEVDPDRETVGAVF